MAPASLNSSISALFNQGTGLLDQAIGAVSPSGSGDLLSAAVDSMQAQTDVSLAAELTNVSQQMSQSLLNILA